MLAHWEKKDCTLYLTAVQTFPASIPVILSTASEGHYIEIKERVILDFYINDVLLSDEFLVVPNLSEEVVLGAATLQKWRIRLDFEHDEVIVDPKVAKLQLI